MTKQEIVFGIKQALEKGDSLEKAKKSFINAGYNPEEVEQAASEAGSFSFPPQQKNKQKENKFKEKPRLKKISPKNFKKLDNYQDKSEKKSEEKSKGNKGWIIILVFILLILIAGLIISVFFKDFIIRFLKTYVSLN